MTRDYKAEYIKTRPRYLQYRKDYSDRYDAKWARSHREARKILEASDEDPTKCYDCGEVRKVRCHHVDGNGLNNEKSNLKWCCYPYDSRQNSRKYVKNQGDSSSSR